MTRLQIDLVLLRLWGIGNAPWHVEARDEESYRGVTERCRLTVEGTATAIRQGNAGDPIASFAIVRCEFYPFLPAERSRTHWRRCARAKQSRHWREHR